MDASKLKETDPSRFNQEYCKWQEYACDYEWWDTTYDCFKEKCAGIGIHVTDIEFNGVHTQGGTAAFFAHVLSARVMQHLKLDQQYLPLYLGCVADHSILDVGLRRGRMFVDESRHFPEVSMPCGVFSDLDKTSWAELIHEQSKEVMLDEKVLELCKDLADDLYKELQAEYEYLTSEDSFIESCEANEITFEEDEDETDT